MTALAVLTVLAVLESTSPSFCLSYKIQHNEATVAVLTVLAVSAVMAVSRNGLDVCYCLPGVPSGARTATELPPMSYAGLYSTQVPHSQDGSRPSPACGVTLRRFPLPFWQVCLSL